MEDRPEDVTASRRSVLTWLFNPFHYVAGAKALAVGMAAILAAGLLGSLSKSHFDGVLDFHTGVQAPLWVFVAEGPIDWIAMAVFVFVGGKIVSRSRFRALDVFGTQAMARLPSLVTALAALMPGYRRYAHHIAAKIVGTLQDVQTNPADIVVFGITALLLITMTVWMVALMYRAYSVSCNVRGGKAIGVFIAALVLAEAASKLLLLAVLRAAGVV